MTPNELKRLFPNATASTIKRNLDPAAPAGGETPGAEPELALRHEALGAVQGKTSHPARFHIRIESRRRRLLDDDNLCGKYFVDCCRYAGLIPDDAPGIVTVETSQTLVATAEEEVTVIDIIPAVLR